MVALKWEEVALEVGRVSKGQTEGSGEAKHDGNVASTKEDGS